MSKLENISVKLEPLDYFEVDTSYEIPPEQPDSLSNNEMDDIRTEPSEIQEGIEIKTEPSSEMLEMEPEYTCSDSNEIKQEADDSDDAFCFDSDHPALKSNSDYKQLMKVSHISSNCELPQLKVFELEPSILEQTQQEQTQLGQTDQTVPSTSSIIETPRNLKRKLSLHQQPSVIKRKKEDNVKDFIKLAIQKLDDISKRAAELRKEDNFDIFGKYCACLLRIIGNPRAIKVQEKITKMLFEEINRSTASNI